MQVTTEDSHGKEKLASLMPCKNIRASDTEGELNMTQQLNQLNQCHTGQARLIHKEVTGDRGKGIKQQKN